MNFSYFFLMFGFGLAVGSFINVLIWRTLNGMSPYKGRSVCDHCKRQLAWYENIPLLSYLALGGKCRTCKTAIDPSYPLVELATGLLFLWWATLGFAFFQLSQAPLTFIQPTFWLLVGVVLVVIFFADLLYGIIPDMSLVILGGGTLLYRLMLLAQGELQVEDFLAAVAVGLVSGAAFWGVYEATRRRGMGFGDVKFAFVMGFLLGFPKAVVGFYLSFILGGAVATGLLLLGRKRVGQKVPFGPFLITGLVLALLFGEQLWHGYLGYLS